jgi:hypothetical protein
MQQHFHEQLYRIATEKMLETAEERSFFCPFTENYFRANLYPLACQAKEAASMTDKEILPAFFADKATAYLLSLPNVYWFWATVREAVLDDRIYQGKRKIALKSVKSAVSRLRRALAHKADLKRPIAKLTAAQLCARTALGIILVKPQRFDLDEIVFNPMFASKPRVS